MLTFFLVLARVGMIIAMLPLIGSGAVPVMVRAMFIFILALVLTPIAGRVEFSGGLVHFGVMMGGELLLGLLMGFAGRVLIKSLRMAGELIGRQMGMALAQMSDPLEGVQSTVVGNFCDVFAVLMMFVTGTHLMFIKGMHESLMALPLGTSLSQSILFEVGTQAVSRAFVIALQIAAPVLIVGFLVSLVMALMARLVPEVNILVLGLPVRLGVGLGMLLVMAPLLVYSARRICDMAVRAFVVPL